MSFTMHSLLNVQQRRDLLPERASKVSDSAVVDSPILPPYLDAKNNKSYTYDILQI